MTLDVEKHLIKNHHENGEIVTECYGIKNISLVFEPGELIAHTKEYENLMDAIYKLMAVNRITA